MLQNQNRHLGISWHVKLQRTDQIVSRDVFSSFDSRFQSAVAIWIVLIKIG